MSDDLMETDNDLVPLLRKCDNNDLSPLVSYITKKGRISSHLDRTNISKKNPSNHKMYADEVAAEIQKCGGNTITNKGRRGKGVPYKEIVCDVAKRLKVNFNKKREVEFIEQQILLKVLEKSWEKMGDEEKMRFMEGLGDEYKSMPIPKIFPAKAFGAFAIKGDLTPYNIAVTVANASAEALLGKVVPLAAGAVGIAGPIGWAITAIWTIFDIAKPAYRVTIPCVLHIAMLRQKYMLEEQGMDVSGGLPGGFANKMPESDISA